MSIITARQFFKDYFTATKNATAWPARYFTAAERAEILEGVMQWQHTTPAFKKWPNK